jgi:short chain dehydrogenase
MNRRWNQERIMPNSKTCETKWIWLAAAGAAAVAMRACANFRNRSVFQGATALVTGGSRGLGLILARQLIGAGARVVICARDPEELDRALDDFTQRGGWAWAIPCDLTDQARVNEKDRRCRTPGWPH